MRSSYLAFGRPDITDEEVNAVSRVMRSGWIGMGEETIRFEAELATYLGAPNVVTVNSCTSALFLSLLATGVGPGDEVICPSLTWCSTANAALYLGATPVFCDVDEETLNATPATVAAALSDRTKAVVLVHFGGLAMDIASIRDVIPADIQIVEDGAHAFGARYPVGTMVGSSGNSVCFSFYANKNLSTAEGGAVALTDDAAAARIRSLRQHGLPVDAWKRFTDPKTTYLTGDVTELGYKMNFTDLQSALGRVQLRRFRHMQERRSEIAEYYAARIGADAKQVRMQQGVATSAHAKHLFVIRLPLEQMKCSRDQFLLSFRERNIGATVHYTPLHWMQLYKDRARHADLPTTERLGARILTLPISASMSLGDAEDVCDHLAAELDRQIT